MADSTKRELKNWLTGFLSWTLPRSETPESMLTWMGLYTLAAVMKRRVQWPRSLMGGYEISPNLYIVLVGEPAVVRKSTTLGFSQSLLYNAPVTFAGDVTSHSKILDALSKSPDGSVAITSGEFSSLVQTTPESTYEILTDIFDNRAKFEWSTWAHGDKSIDKPVVNLAACTTPAWMSRQPQEYFVGGGFASRVLFLYEEEPRQLEIYYDHLDHEKLTVLERQLIEDLNSFSKLEGDIRHDSDKTKEHIRAWYKSHVQENVDPRLKGYFGRKHVHAHKVAALLSIAERNDLKVTVKHWNQALKLLAYIEQKMPKAFAGLGVNPFSSLMDNIYDYLVQVDGEVMLNRIAARFYREGITLEQLKSALAFLTTTGKVKAKGTESPSYSVVKGK